MKIAKPSQQTLQFIHRLYDYLRATQTLIENIETPDRRHRPQAIYIYIYRERERERERERTKHKQYNNI